MPNSIIAIIIPLAFFMFMTFILSFGVTGTTPSAVQTQIDGLNCPMPQLQGSPYPFPNANQYTNATYNTRSASNSTLTLSCTPVHTLNGKDYNYGQPAVAIGVFFYALDYLSELVHKIGAVLTIVGLMVTPPSSIPANVNTALFLFVYIPMYVMLGFGIYKGVNPLGD